MIPVLPKIPQPAFMTIPIVGGVGPDQLAAGLVTSFSPPVGNVTGFSAFGVELSAKRLQLLKEASPAILHLATCGTRLAPRQSAAPGQAVGRCYSMSLAAPRHFRKEADLLGALAIISADRCRSIRFPRSAPAAFARLFGCRSVTRSDRKRCGHSSLGRHPLYG